MAEPKCPDIIIERAVELWCRALAHPRHDNGDNSEHGFIASGLAGMNLDREMSKVDDYPAAIERFRAILTEKLKWLRDHEGEPTGEQGHFGPKKVYFERRLETDYHPDHLLAEAAAAAGVPSRAFSWKSHVHFYSDDCVGAEFGYAARSIYHYPMPSGGWLVCQLRGEDMPKIIRAVEAGVPLGLTVERPGGSNV